ENSVRRHAANLIPDIGRIGRGGKKHGSANPVLHVREICRIRGITDRSAAPCYEVKAGGLDFSAHRRIRHHPDMMPIVAQPPPRGQHRAQISQGAPRRQQKMIRHLRSLLTVATSLTRSLLRDRSVLPDGCVAAHVSARATPRLGGARYRTMSHQSEMVTSVRMSATIMAQRSDLAGQRSFRVT